jgi:hypothetical protein
MDYEFLDYGVVFGFMAAHLVLAAHVVMSFIG